MTHLAKWLVLVLLELSAAAHASTPIPVLITQRDGTSVPFSLQNASYRDGQRSATWGQFWLEVNGVSTVVPLERIVRAHLVSPGTPTRVVGEAGRLHGGPGGDAVLRDTSLHGRRGRWTGDLAHPRSTNRGSESRNVPVEAAS